MKSNTPARKPINNCLSLRDSLWNTRLTLVFANESGQQIEKPVILLGGISQDQFDILANKAINGHQMPASYLSSLLEDELEADTIANGLISIKELADDVTEAEALHTNAHLTLPVPVGAVIAGLVARSWGSENQIEGEDNDDDLFRYRTN